ncbi:MAG: DUF5615 family PIN-like protein [Xanthobacteraceae bacterium]
MRWLADECVAAAVVECLREAWHDVAYVAEIARSASDIEIVNEAHSQGRLLLTEDKDFGELVFRWRRRLPGLVLLRIEPEVGDLKWTRLNAAILIFGDGLLGRYTVVEEARFRSRPLIEMLPRPSRP